MSCRIYSDTDEPEREETQHKFNWGEIPPQITRKEIITQLLQEIPPSHWLPLGSVAYVSRREMEKEIFLEWVDGYSYPFQVKRIKTMDQVGKGIDPPKFYQGEVYPSR